MMTKYMNLIDNLLLNTSKYCKIILKVEQFSDSIIKQHTCMLRTKIIPYFFFYNYELLWIIKKDLFFQRKVQTRMHCKICI